jgi:hypothetical protein
MANGVLFGGTGGLERHDRDVDNIIADIGSIQGTT